MRPRRFAEWFKLAGRQDAKPRLIQLWEMVRLAGSGRYSPGEYWVYGFYRQGVRVSDMLDFMASRVHYEEHLTTLVHPTAIPVLENKWLFHLHLSAQGLPLPECYGVFAPSFGFAADGGPMRSADDLGCLLARVGRPIIAKPVLGSQGRGVHVLDPSTDAREAAHRLAKMSRREGGGGMLLQERLDQHEAMEELSPTAAVNLRVITLRGPSEVAVTSASMRIGRVGATMSNASQGGLLGQIDPAGGEITAARNGLYLGSELVERHPDTGLRIVGRTVPEWDRVREVCIAAAGHLPAAASVGWDVILTPAGPKILEANHDWDMISEQLFETGYLARNRERLREHGLEFPSGRLPRFRPSNLLAFIWGPT